MEIALRVLLGLYTAAAAALAAYGVNCYVMMALFARRRRQAREEESALLARFAQRPPEAAWPVVTTQLPIFNERNVIERLLRAVCAFDYPQGRHEIQVLDDSTDDTSELVGRLVAQMREAGHDVHHIQRTHRTGYKAGALAEGLKVARGELVAVFDADFVPQASFLRQTVPFLVMEPRCGFVQTRWGHRNRSFSFLTMAQSIGIDGHFVVEQSARAWNRLFLNFNGTAGIWRKAAIADAGGWSADTLTEDLDLSYRTQLAGWTARFLFGVVTPAEIPTDINAFKAQQRRWAKGSIQTALKLLPTVLRRADQPLFKRLQAVLHLTHYLVHPLILTMTLLVLPLLLWARGELFGGWIMVPLAGLLTAALFAPSSLYLFSQRMAGRSVLKTIPYLPGLMALGVGLAVNNTRAVLEALTGHKSGFVRTPKLGSGAEAEAPASVRRYRLPLSGLFWIELFMGAWGLAGFAAYLRLTRFVVGPVILIHALGFTYVGLLSLVHHRRVRRRQLEASTRTAASAPQPDDDSGPSAWLEAG